MKTTSINFHTDGPIKAEASTINGTHWIEITDGGADGRSSVVIFCDSFAYAQGLADAINAAGVVPAQAEAA